MISKGKVGIGCLVLAGLATNLEAAGPDTLRQIVVIGHGSVSVPPDTTTLSFHLRGEGATSDEAVRSLVAKRAQVDRNLASIGVAQASTRTDKLSIEPVRGKDCDAGDNDDSGGKPRLSEGPCAVRGYIAGLGFSIMMPPKNVGTAAGLVGRAGADTVSVEDFDLRDDSEARRKAIAVALLDARAQAEAIAAGSGEPLGALLSVSDVAARAFAANDIVVTAERASAPAIVAPPPVVVDLAPKTVERSADLTVTYAIGK